MSVGDIIKLSNNDFVAVSDLPAFISLSQPGFDCAVDPDLTVLLIRI